MRWNWTTYGSLESANVPNTAVNSGGSAWSRTFLALLLFSERNRIDVYVFLQPTTDSGHEKTETIINSFCNHRVISSSRQQKAPNQAGICINESYRPTYFNSFWQRHPHKEYEIKRSVNVFVKCYFIHRRSLWRHASVSFTAHNRIIPRMINSCILYSIQGCPKLACGW